MKKLLAITSMLLILLTGCGGNETSTTTSEEDTSLTQTTSSQEDVSSEETELPENTREILINEDSIIAPVNMAEFDVYDPQPAYLYPEEFGNLPCINDYQAMDLNVSTYDDTFYNHWYAVTDVYLTDCKDNSTYYSQWGTTFMVAQTRFKDNFAMAYVNDEPITVIGYFTKGVDGYVFSDCFIVDANEYNIYNNVEMQTDGISDPTDPTGPNGTIEDYIDSQNNPNAPIDQQIIDGIGDAFDYAAQDPNQSQENQDFAQAFGDAWDFAAALKRAGY